MIRFLLAALSASIVVIGVTFAWPRLTTQPRPEAMQKIYETVADTSIGKNVASVLGVSTEATATPINVASVAGTVTNSFIQNLEEQAGQAATRELIIQVVKKIETLGPAQQEQVKQAICK